MNANTARMNVAAELNSFTMHQLESNSIVPQFPDEIANLEENDLDLETCRRRKDFRCENAFTIDCSDCKDMDDAVSIAKTESGYRLSVHIADVSAFVPVGSALDKLACDRATSVYLPNLTVPMLPTVLSNNCCSLNPGADRYTLSVVMELDHSGHVVSSEITKGVIRSRVKGIYSEVNRLLDGDRDKSLMKKYSTVFDQLHCMEELFRILRAERIEGGATVSDQNLPIIKIRKNGIDLIPHTEGTAENIIEEFMVLANSVVAEYLYDNDLPAIFRIQEEKNNLAAYQPVKSHHAELALESYSHFTSPIRRVADLKIHQIISMYLNGCSLERIHEAFDEHLPDVCDRATKRSRTAKTVQDRCNQFCYCRFFQSHPTYRYTGTVIGADWKNKPVIQISDYNIKIKGIAACDFKKGDKLSFTVRVFEDEFRLGAKGMRRKKAA